MIQIMNISCLRVLLRTLDKQMPFPTLPSLSSVRTLDLELII